MALKLTPMVVSSIAESLREFSDIEHSLYPPIRYNHKDRTPPLTTCLHRTMKTETFLLPSHWASALINNDWTGIEDDLEEEVMLSFLANEAAGLEAVDVSETSEFSKYHDAHNLGVLAADCSVFTFT